VVSSWTREVEGQRLGVERELRETTSGQVLSESEVRSLVEAVRSGLTALDGASVEQRAAIYSSVGLRLTYHADRAVIEVEARPGPTRVLRCVSEGVSGFRTLETSQVGDVSRHRRHRRGGLRWTWALF
jgi:hypothetical protein